MRKVSNPSCASQHGGFWSGAIQAGGSSTDLLQLEQVPEGGLSPSVAGLPTGSSGNLVNMRKQVLGALPSPIKPSLSSSSFRAATCRNYMLHPKSSILGPCFAPLHRRHLLRVLK